VEHHEHDHDHDPHNHEQGPGPTSRGRAKRGREHHREHEHDHEHGHNSGLWRRLTHSHDTGDKVDSALEASREGLRALWLSLAGLAVTAVLQAVVAVWSGSVALLGDTLHNVADALTAVPLGVAFLLGRRPPNRRYTYGYGRAEDLAGIVIVLTITASAVFAAYAAVERLLHPAGVTRLPFVAAAGLIG